MKLILKNGAEFIIDDYTSSSFLMSCTSFQEAVITYNEMMTGDNLSSISVENDGVTVLAADNLISDGVQITPTPTGFTAIFYYHGSRAVNADAEYAQIGRILMGEEVQA